MPHFFMGMYIMLLGSSYHETLAFSLGKVNYRSFLIKRKSMLKEVTAQGETVCGFILVLVLRRLLIVYFSQEVGGVAREELRQVSQSVLAQSYSYCVSQSWSSQTSLQLHG